MATNRLAINTPTALIDLIGLSVAASLNVLSDFSCPSAKYQIEAVANNLNIIMLRFFDGKFNMRQFPGIKTTMGKKRRFLYYIDFLDSNKLDFCYSHICNSGIFMRLLS